MQLIESGKAYVCSLTPEEIREYRGTLTAPGKESPYRNRSVEENLDLFERMRGGEFAEGAHVLRAKIDMASPNIVMRDPDPLPHQKGPPLPHRRAWCIYPMYDFAHCLSDAIEGITHSICTLEFENNRPLYDWILDELKTPCHPQQIEFARLNLSHTVMSKRKLAELVRKETGQRLGRPPHAHAGRHAPARLYAGGDPRILRAHRRGQARQHGRYGAARTLRAGRS